MKLTNKQQWLRFKQNFTHYPQLGLSLDLSRMHFGPEFFANRSKEIAISFKAMAELERGAIANPDEKRMVGHYWLRNPAIAPTKRIRREIETTLANVKKFAAAVHSGQIAGAGGPFKNLLVIGIGGSALGPQFVSKALGHPLKDKLQVLFFDNTDPDGIDLVLARIRHELDRTLCVAISKSGGTPETRNGMLEAKAAYERAGLDFGKHTLAITQTGSKMDEYATKHGWIKRFPMWDWVGGRTSELSAVGILPAVLQGIDIDSMLAGAKACDEETRKASAANNPAMRLALMWHFIGNGKGNKDMVILPYKDRLELFAKYLQQLIMESLGKEKDLGGETVNQGIAVYGNKGSTDQHAYIQQLRDGVNNFFATFIEVQSERSGESILVDTGATSGDYLEGFLLGTRKALFEKDRQSVTITVSNVSPFSIGVLIALFERAVGFYARLVNINAYHQPGVEAGKKAASEILGIQLQIMGFLARNQNAKDAAKKPKSYSAEEIAEGINTDDIETVFKLCERLAANPGRGILKIAGRDVFSATYRKV